MADLIVSSDVDSFMAAANAAAMRSALGVGTIATQAASAVAITGGTLSGITALTCTGLVTITQATANTGILASTGYSLTGTNATNMLNFTGTLNTSGVPTILNFALTETAAAIGTKYFEFLGGASGTTSLLSLKKRSTGLAELVIGGSGFSPTLYEGSSGMAYVGRSDGGASYCTFGFDGVAAGFSTAVTGFFSWSSSGTAVGLPRQGDLLLTRKAAAALQLGADANGVPVNQTISACNGITGTDKGGANLTFDGGNITGAGTPGSLIFRTSTAGSTGTTVGTYSTRLTIDGTGLLTFADAVNMAFNTTTGTKIGTATTQKLAFWNATPVVQPSHIADPSGGAVQDAESRTAIAAINAMLAATGITAAA